MRFVDLDISKVNYLIKGEFKLNWKTLNQIIMLKNFTIAALAFLLFGTNCFAQALTISYNNPNNTFSVNTTITQLIPTFSGAAPTSYAISKHLPDGLDFNKTTGVISGTPLTATPMTYFLITATRGAETSSYNLKITVNPEAPNISYTSALTATANTKIVDQTPVNTGGAVDKYEIIPAPPSGLTFNVASGVISGTPNASSATTDYTITATNATGTSSFKINITVGADPKEVTTSPTIEFVGQGNIQPSISNGSKIPATTGIGVIYTENLGTSFTWLHNIRLEFSLNVASTVDTIKSINDANNRVTNIRDFGNSILIPLSSGQAYSFNFIGYVTRKGDDPMWRRNKKPLPVLWGLVSGFNVSFVGSNRNWEYDSTYTVNNNNTTAQKLVKTSMISLYAGLFHEFIPFEDRPNNSITIGLGYSGRFIAGDIAQTTESNLRNKLLGSTTNSFNGYEISLGIRFSNIKAEVRVPFMPRIDSIPGLSGVQPNTFIAFSGGFPIDLTKTGK